MSAPQISEKTREKIRSFLTFNFGGSDKGQTFFRRADKVIGTDLQYIAKIQTPDLPVEYLTSLKGVSKEDRAKHIQVTYKSFHGFTRTQMVRDEPIGVLDTPIFFHSKNYRQLDLSVNMTFDFSTNHKKLTTPVTPVPGDLLFIFLSNKTLDEISEVDGNKKNHPSADLWFIASEQFLKAYTAIVCDWTDSFNLLISVPVDAPREILEEALRYKLFSGNKLMTNTWAKYALELESQGKIMSREESIKRYWILRSEYVSKRWIDVWAALVLIARYGELPCVTNVPNTRNSDTCKRTKWDIPHNLIRSLCKKSLNAEEFIELDKLISSSEEINRFSDKSEKRTRNCDIFIENNFAKPALQNAEECDKNAIPFISDIMLEDTWASKVRYTKK